MAALPVEAASLTMRCARCDARNGKEAKVCANCGEPLDAVSATETTKTVDPIDTDRTAEDLAPESRRYGRVPEALRLALTGRFEIERLLGRGGMASVYLAREIALDRLVAIKVLPIGADPDDERVRRFMREARMSAKLRHPNIAAVYAVGGTEGVHYFTMDYIDGDTLDGWTRRGVRRTATEVDRIFLDICRAVEHAHRLGVVHRDLKPSNVMIDRGGHVFVTDFGLAKVMESSAITRDGGILGTPRYLSPEQIEGSPASTRSDIYALGLVYYFLLTGTHLVGSESLPMIVAQHLAGSFLTAITSNEKIPERLRPILLTMLSREKKDRPPSIEAIVAALEAVRDGRSAAPPPSRVGPKPAPELQEGKSPLSVRRQARDRMKTLLDRLERDPKK
jgi:serine/threonine protein kinase